MPFGQRLRQDPDPPESGRTIGMRAGLVANVLLALVLLLPIATAVSIFGSVNFHLWRAMPSHDPLFSKIEAAQRASGVVSGDDIEELKHLYQRLEGMTARSAEAKKATALHMVFNSFDPKPAQKEGIAERPSDPARQTVSLDLSEIGASAVVLIADRPTVWQITGAKPGARAKIGFEGPFAFDLTGAEDGLLAGFRIGAFGAGEISRPVDYAEFQAGKASKRAVCNALDRWLRYFAVPKENTHVWSMTNARRIEIGQSSVKADTRVASDVNEISRVCQP